ncbi:MAG TPA: YdcF family protein [Terracidiphilus sp.]|nr:YdcF family protein [Terracidiphilus sp.]
MGWRGRAAWTVGLLMAAVLGWAAVARATAPASNTEQTRFDVIIVLGSPADSDGNPTPKELARVNEGVREYERDVAPRMIFTGGATRKNYVEAQVMSRAAEAEGIPASAIYLEPRAMDTIHNACYSVRLMKAHGWHSAEVVSSGNHLPRAGLILSRLPIEWRTHAAPALEPESSLRRGATEALEMLSMVHYLVYARWAEGCTP